MATFDDIHVQLAHTSFNFLLLGPRDARHCFAFPDPEAADSIQPANCPGRVRPVRKSRGGDREESNVSCCFHLPMAVRTVEFYSGIGASCASSRRSSGSTNRTATYPFGRWAALRPVPEQCRENGRTSLRLGPGSVPRVRGEPRPRCGAKGCCRFLFLGPLRCSRITIHPSHLCTL